MDFLMESCFEYVYIFHLAIFSFSGEKVSIYKKIGETKLPYEVHIFDLHVNSVDIDKQFEN